MKTKNRIGQYVIILIAAAILASAATRLGLYLYDEATIYDVQDINATFVIGDKVGLSVDPDVLNFGVVYPGSTSTKEIRLFHTYEKPLRIKIVYIGNIREVLLPIPSFYLEPNVEKRVDLTAYAIYNQQKNFTGIVRVLYLKQ